MIVPATLRLTADFGEDAMVAGPFACTRAFCASAPLDAEFVGLLEGRSSVSVDGDRLVLSSDGGALIFVR